MAHGGKGKRHWTRSAVALAGGLAQRAWNHYRTAPAKRQKTSHGVATKTARAGKRTSGSKSMLQKKGSSLFQSGKVGIGGTFSSFRQFSRNKKSIRPGKLLGKSVFNISGALRITGAIGQQAVTTVMNTCSDAQLTSMMVGAGGSGTRDSYKFLLKDVTGFTIYTNQSNGNVNLKLYDVICRKDLGSGSAVDPSSAWYNGMTDNVTTGTVSSVSSTNLGSTPFMSPLFCQYFKVLKVTSIILAAGQSHHHYVKRTLNRMINDELLTYYTNLAYLTHYTVAAAFGYPENDTTTNTIVSTCAVGIDAVSEFKFRWAYSAINFNRSTYTNTLGSIATGELMQIAAGVVKTETQA